MKRFLAVLILLILIIPKHSYAVRDKIRFIPGGDVVSASELILREGSEFDVTGTTTISSIAHKELGAIVALQFDGILQLTHSADLFMPTAANVTTAAGDIALFYEYATGDWRCMSYQRADGSVLSYGSTIGNRDFASTAMTNGDTQTALTEANMLAAKHVTNQGETVETDIILVAVSYPIGLIFDNDEGIVMEVCPPSGETVYLDGVILDADDCVDLAAAVDNTFTARRRQNASAAWYWSFTSVTGALTDTAGTD